MPGTVMGSLRTRNKERKLGSKAWDLSHTEAAWGRGEPVPEWELPELNHYTVAWRRHGGKVCSSAEAHLGR